MPTLLSLPQEFIDRIITYAVVEESPVYVFMDVRFKQKGSRLRKHVKARSKSPALASVNRKLREDTLSIYWRDNIFKIEIENHENNPVQRWFCYYTNRDIVSRQFRQMNIEFYLDLPEDGLGEDDLLTRCEVSIRNSSDSEVTVERNGGIEKECTCSLYKAMNRLIARYLAFDRNPVLAACNIVDEFFIPDDGVARRAVAPAKTCLKCMGAIRFGRRLGGVVSDDGDMA